MIRNEMKSFWRRVLNYLRDLLRWFAPGLHVKRWFLLILSGTTLLAIGFAVLVLDVYRTAPDGWWIPILSFLSLRFLDRTVRALIFGLLGLGLLFVGISRLYKSLLTPFMPAGRRTLDTITEHRKRERGPRVVALGGGTGLSSLLRGLKNHTFNITAVVTVADDGGSSGELREKLGVLPPGDIRNCLAALSNDEALLTQMFQYRFADNTGLKGHSLGNLLITAMADISGSFEKAIAEAGKVLAVHGQVLPTTLRDIQLQADVEEPSNHAITRVKGESSITKKGGTIKRVWLEPSNPPAYPGSLQGILNADLIVIGPGSLYTSLMPNLLIPEIISAIRSSHAIKFYVCNIATQPGETDGFDCLDHVRAIERHVGGRIFDIIVCNDLYEGPMSENSDWVRINDDMRKQYAVYSTRLSDKSTPWRHDSQNLARIIMDLYNDRTSPMAS